MGFQDVRRFALMGHIHSAVATVRDWAGVLDASALRQILGGEQMIVDSYASAIAMTQVGSSLNRALEGQCPALRAQIAVLKS